MTDPEASRWNAVTLHELLRERLARFEGCGSRGGTDNLLTNGREHVDDAAAERQLWSDNRQIDSFVASDAEKLVEIACINGHAARDRIDAWVPGRAEERGYCTLAGQLPRKRMFARPGADDQDLHLKSRQPTATQRLTSATCIGIGGGMVRAKSPTISLTRKGNAP